MVQFISLFTMMVLRFESSSGVGLLVPENGSRNGETGNSREKLRSCAISTEDSCTTSIGLSTTRMLTMCTKLDLCLLTRWVLNKA
jgi:hypothetical protein